MLFAPRIFSRPDRPALTLPRPERLFLQGDSLLFVASLLVALAFVLITIAIPLSGGMFLDTVHLPDTLFILGAAWRAYQGLNPVVDFGYFYGGVIEQFVALNMNLFGDGIFAFYAALLLMALLFALAAVVALNGRISRAGLGVIIMTTTCLLLTHHPLEYEFAVAGVVSAHSFLYNRFGLAALVIVGTFLSLEPGPRRADGGGGLVIGLLVALTALVKPSFTILALSAIAGLIVQRRWPALVGLLGGAMGVFLLIDPQLDRMVGAIRYVTAQLGGDRGAQPEHLVMRALLVPLVQPLASGLALVAIAHVALQRAVPWQALAGVVLVALAGIGMTATMGGKPGQLALPIMLMVALAAAEWAGRYRLERALPLRLLALVMAAALALPHAVNLAGVALLSHLRADQALISTGPFARYLAIEKGNLTAPPQPIYVAFADGIAELNRMGDASKWGIVADLGISFEYAMRAPPVPGFPLWQKRTAPELAPGRPLDPRADVVMIGRDSFSISLRDELTERMGENFRLCRRSVHWDIHVRQGLRGATCMIPDPPRG